MEESVTLQLEKLCADLAALAKDENPESKKELRDKLNEEFRTLAEAQTPRTDEEKAALEKLVRRFDRADKNFSTALFQLFQTRDLERWEHYALKLQICKKLEEFDALPDEELPSIARKFRELTARWNALGSVPHEKSEELWLRFKELNANLNRRVNAVFAKRSADRLSADEKKQALLAETRALCEDPNFAKATPRLKEIQTEWKAAGPGTPKLDRELFAEFRALCDKFFASRSEFFSERKNTFNEAAERKKELIAAAEALRTTPPDDIPRVSRRLYIDWRNAPFAGREDRKLYEQFKKAQDAAFDRLRRLDAEYDRSKQECCAEFAALEQALAANGVPADEAASKYRELCARYSAIPGVSAKPDAMKRAECAKIERHLSILHFAAFKDASAARRELEKTLALALEADEVTDDFGELAARFAACAAKSAAEALERLAEEPAERRRKGLEKFTEKRRLVLDRADRLLGRESSLQNDVEFLARALENAMRGDFRPRDDGRITAAVVREFEEEFFASPLALSGAVDDLYDRFIEAINGMNDKIQP